MNSEILKNIQAKLGEITALKYKDEDWGQLEDYGPHVPVQWPCCLIDFADINYSDIGTDRSQTPQKRQRGIGTIALNFANLKLTKTSANAPALQREQAYMLLGIIQAAHEILQGFRPIVMSGGMNRSRIQRVKRDDGIQQYRVTYTLGVDNV